MDDQNYSSSPEIQSRSKFNVYSESFSAEYEQQDMSGEISDEDLFLDELKHFSEKSENFAIHFSSITRQLFSLLCAKSSSENDFIVACLDEWLRIARVASQFDKLRLYDANFIKFQQLAKLLVRIGCYSTQMKILAIFFEYASFKFDVDAHQKISSLFKDLVEDSNAISEQIESSYNKYSLKQNSDTSRQLLNIINNCPMTKVVSKRIQRLQLEPVSNMITSEIGQEYIDFNFGTKTIEFHIRLNFFDSVPVSIEGKSLESVWIKGEETHSIRQLTIVLFEPLCITWISDRNQQSIDVKLQKEIVIQMCDAIDHNEMQTLLQQIWPGKLEIKVTAMFHAEHEWESDEQRHSVPVTKLVKRPTPPSKQAHLDEIFPIPVDINWRHILTDLDSYRPTETAKNPQASILSDTEEEKSDNDVKVIHVSSDESTESNLDKTKSPVQINVKIDVELSGPRPSKTRASVLNRKMNKFADRKRGFIDLGERVTSKRIRKTTKIESSGNEDSDDDDTNDVAGAQSQQSTRSNSPIDNSTVLNKYLKSYGQMSSTESKISDDPFDVIASTPTYERGQINPKVIFSYRAASSLYSNRIKSINKDTNSSKSD